MNTAKGGLLIVAGLFLVWLATTGRLKAVVEALGFIRATKPGSDLATGTQPGIFWTNAPNETISPVVYQPEPGEISVSDSPFFQRLVALDKQTKSNLESIPGGSLNIFGQAANQYLGMTVN